jgi:hypothetical protein
VDVQLSLVKIIKLAVVNAYLNVFGRFELGITLLVKWVFPAKIKNIFEGLFACYKSQAALGLGNDMVRSTPSWVTLRARWVTLRARWVTLRARWVTAKSSLGDAESSRGDAKSSLGGGLELAG